MKNSKALRVLIAGSILQLFLGIIYTWSVFVGPVSEFFVWDPTSVKLTASYMLSFFVLGILAGGKFQLKVGASKVVLAGGMALAVGMLATSFIPLHFAWIIYITYGILGGFGVGMAYSAITTCAQKWFPAKRGLATGISTCCFGFSTVIFAPLVEMLIKTAGLLNTFRILAAVFSIAVLGLFYFIELPDEQVQQSKAAEKLLKEKQYTTSEMLRTRNFYFVTLSMMFGTASYFILNPSFKSLALERGLSAAMSTAIVMICGVANSVGRLIMPLISSKLGRERTTMMSIILTALCTFSLRSVTGMLFIIVVAVITCCYGGYSGLYPLITADRFGIRNVGSNYGAIMIGFGISALVFPILISKIQDESIRFVVLSLMAVAGAALVFGLTISKNTKEKV